jgi:hypothetical protein
MLKIKKLCLHSVSMVVFLSALSTPHSSYGMDKKKEDEKEHQITVKPMERSDLNNKSTSFHELASGVIELIFPYLNPKDEASLRLGCKKLYDLSNKSRKQLEKEVPSTFEDLLTWIFFRPSHFSIFLDRLILLGSPEELYSMRGIPDKIKSQPKFKKTFQEEILRTGKKLGFLSSQENKIICHYETFPKTAENIQNHLFLKRHLKALWLFDELEEEASATEKNWFSEFEKILSSSLPSTFEKNLEFKGFAELPFWAGFSKNSETWRNHFKEYILDFNIKLQPLEIEKINNFFEKFFPTKSTPLRTYLYLRGYYLQTPEEVEKDLRETTLKFKEIDSPHFCQLMDQIETYNSLEEYEESFKLFESVLNNFEEKGEEFKNILKEEVVVKEEGDNVRTEVRDVQDLKRIRLYVLNEYLRTILKSNFFIQNKKKVFNFFKELEKEITEDLNCCFVVDFNTEQNKYNVEIEKYKMSFYKSCFNYLLKQGNLQSCFSKEEKDADNLKILFKIIFNKNSEKLEENEKFLLKEMIEKYFELDGFSSERYYRIHRLNTSFNKQQLIFIRNLFLNEETKLKKIIPELFEDEKEKK